METLPRTVQRNAASAQYANELAARGSSVAGRGGDVMTQVVSTTGEILDGVGIFTQDRETTPPADGRALAGARPAALQFP